VKLERLIRDVPDFPKPGIVFKDITPLLRDPAGFRAAVEGLAAPLDGREVGAVVGIESRGFLFGAALALKLGTGFVPIRKPRKLPWKTRSESYALEYGTDTVEIHEDAVGPGTSVLIVDDLLATGGTMEAACRLVEGLGGEIVACSVVVELAFLKGRERLPGRRIHSLIRYGSPR
jgi:adenine phosphoribosyltransferase